MKHTRPAEDTGRVVSLAVAFFGTLAAVAWMEGVFGRLDDATLAALALFGFAYAVATYALDRGVRDWVNRRLAVRSAARVTKAPGKSPGGSPAAT